MNANPLPSKPVLAMLYQEITSLKQAELINGITLNCRYDYLNHTNLAAQQDLIIHAIKDMEWFSSFIFPIESNLPDPVKMKVVEMEAGHQQYGNCSFTVHIEFTNSYTEKEILNTVKNHTFCQFSVSHSNPKQFDKEQVIRLLNELMPYVEAHLDSDKQQLILDNC